MKYLLIIFTNLYLVNCQLRNINDFKMITWNSDGPKWNNIFDYFESSNADVMCVQECGTITKDAVLQDRLSPTVYLGWTPIDESLTILEYEIQSRGRTLYLYYYDRNTRTRRIEPNKNEFKKVLKKNSKRLNNNQQTSTKDRKLPIDESAKKQNMVVISREPARELYILPMIGSDQARLTSEDERYYINRPVIGIRIDDAVFLNIHAEPSSEKNEAVGIINEITDSMARIRPSLSWILMGDFNRDDNVLTLADISSISPNFISREIIRTGQPTRQLRVGQNNNNRALRELDYAIAMFPAGISSHKLVAQLLSFYFANHRIHYINGNSDHVPVIFTV